MELREACEFLERLSGVQVLVGDGPRALEHFCVKNRFHKIQRHLTPQELEKLLNSAAENEQVSVEDELQVRLQFGRINKDVFIFGPYCCESLSTLDARILLSRCEIPETEVRAFLAYRSRFPVLSEQRAQQLVRGLLIQLSGSELLPPARSMDFLRPPLMPASHVEQPYADIISERYAIEMDMMAAIRSGNAARAIQDWRQLHLRMDYLRGGMGGTIQNAVISSSITRTVLRVACMEAGVPPVVIDDLTGRARQKTTRTKSLDEMQHITEVLIRELCRAVRAQKRSGAGYLVEAAMYYMEAHYSDELTISSLAEHLNTAESRLIQVFREQTGITPGAYLKGVRMKRAAELLLGTRKSIQEIAADVGISDANYFTKLFRSEYGKTPSAYRRGIM
jgi:AraC-like DNA-binding protein